MASTADNLLEVVNDLERQPLRNIVLLKHIEAFPEHVSAVQVFDGPDTATLVLLDTSASPYDRETYPAGGIRRTHIERPPAPDASAARSGAHSQRRVQACQ